MGEDEAERTSASAGQSQIGKAAPMGIQWGGGVNIGGGRDGGGRGNSNSDVVVLKGSAGQSQIGKAVSIKIQWGGVISEERAVTVIVR